MTAKKVNIELLTDLPIKSSVDDKFGRKDFVNAIADIIYSQSTEVNAAGEAIFKNVDENLIIGLYGSWGHGKSSIINLLKEKLEEKELQTVYFNPWMYGSENQLIASLFKVILKHTSLTDTPLKKLTELFKKYFSLIAVVNQQSADVGLALIDSIEKEPKSAEEIKKAIDKILSGTANPLTIFIDDVDRLSKDEIHVLFKTLRLIASFKHVIYVVAFDFEMVAKSIKEKYVDGNEEDGKAFLEKIIQIPIRIPDIKNEYLLNYAIEQILTTIQVNITGHTVIKLLFENYFKTPRDVNRFINALRFSKHYYGEDILDNELIILELIRTKATGLFELIKIYYTASISIEPNETLEKLTNKFISNFFKLPVDQLNHDKQFTTFKFVINFLFGYDIMIYFFNSINPNHRNSNPKVKLKEFLIQSENNSEINRSIRNPKTLQKYFEKSAEINQDEAPTEH